VEDVHRRPDMQVIRVSTSKPTTLLTSRLTLNQQLQMNEVPTLSALAEQFNQVLRVHGYACRVQTDCDHILLFAMTPEHGDISKFRANATAVTTQGHTSGIKFENNESGPGFFSGWLSSISGAGGPSKKQRL